MKDNKYKELFGKTTLDSSVKKKIEDKIYMLNFKLEVGESEKHMVEFVLNQFWGYVEIKVDGQIHLQKKLKGVWFKQNWTYSIVVGNVEKHEVRIELVRSLFPVGLRECTAWVYVDDKKTVEHTGKLSARDRLFTGMNRRIKTAIIITSLVILAVLSSVIIYSWPIRVDKVIDGVLFRGGPSEPEYSESMSITINGKYHRRIFSYDQFVGEVYIRDLHPNIDEEVLQQETILDFYKGKPAALGYWKINIGSFSDRIRVGHIYMEPGAKAIMILVVEKDDNGEDSWYGGNEGLFYAAPCNSREEALEVVNELIPKVWSRKVNPIE